MTEDNLRRRNECDQCNPNAKLIPKRKTLPGTRKKKPKPEPCPVSFTSMKLRSYQCNANTYGVASTLALSRRLSYVGADTSANSAD